jgi:hypothetical protein
MGKETRKVRKIRGRVIEHSGYSTQGPTRRTRGYERASGPKDLKRFKLLKETAKSYLIICFNLIALKCNFIITRHLQTL